MPSIVCTNVFVQCSNKTIICQTYTVTIQMETYFLFKMSNCLNVLFFQLSANIMKSVQLDDACQIFK